MTREFDLCWWWKISCSETNADMFLWKVNFSSAKNWGGRIYFSTGTFVLTQRKFFNTPLAHLSVTTRSPPYSLKRFGLFALTATVAILMNWHLLMTHPVILVPNAMPLTFFSIPQSNRLGFPILLITVQSPSLHFFFQVLTVILIKKYFGYLVVHFLIAEAIPKSLAYRPISFLIFAGFSTWFFFRRSYVFCNSAEVTFSITEVRTLVIWIPSVSSLLCDFFLKLRKKFFFVHLFLSS